MYKNKKILAIILARGGSKGIKNKNLKKINGISLVGRIGLFLKKIRYIDFSVVSTNSNKIGKEASKYNLNFFFRRPAHLSGPKISDEQVLKHALLETEKKTGKKFDVIVSLAPTSPLRKANDVVNSIKKLIDKKFEAVWTISKTDKKYHPFKALVINKKNLSFFSNQGHKIKYRQQLKSTYFRNGAAYVLSKKTVLNGKILTSNSGYVISKTKQISIDNLDDLKKVRKILTKKK